MIRMAFSMGAFCLLLGMGILMYRALPSRSKEAKRVPEVTAPLETPSSEATSESTSHPEQTGAAPSGLPSNANPANPGNSDRLSRPATSGSEEAQSGALGAAPRPATASPSEAAEQQEGTKRPSSREADAAADQTPPNQNQNQSQRSAEKITYKVRSGDTLWRISQAHYGSSKFITHIARANGFTIQTALRPGQLLVIPAVEGMRRTSPQDADHETASATGFQKTYSAPTPIRSNQPSADFRPIPPSLSRSVPLESPNP